MTGLDRPTAGERARVTARRASEMLPLGLAFIAEAGWLAVVAGMIQALARTAPVISLPMMALLVAAGALVGRIAAPRLGGGWPPLAVSLMVAGGALGVLLSADARAVLAAMGLAGAVEAVGANPGGLLAGLAVLRGTAYATPGMLAERMERVLAAGTAVIVVAAVIGGLLPDPWRATFIADALVAGLAFAAAGIVALALRRQALEGRDRGADWQRNPGWLVLLVLVVAAIAVLAAISTGLVRPALEVLIGVSIVPLFVVGLIFGWTRRGLHAAAGFALIGGVVALAFHLSSAPLGVIEVDPIGPQPPPSPPPGELEPSVVAFGAGMVALLAIIAAYLLARWWARRVGRAEGDPSEVRYIDPPAAPRASAGRRWLPRLGLRRTPRDAVAAYRSLLRELDQRDVVRRHAWETPREHAARLRREEIGRLSLELLAADYALVVFGGATLTDREQRRAVARWRSLRRSLRAPEPPPELPDA